MVAVQARQQAPPTPKNFAHKSCWFDGQGHKICGDWSSTSHNLTDIHRQDGVADLHNEHNSNKNETIHGVTFKEDPSKPNAQFEGHKQDENQGFRDAHDDQDEWTDHKDDSGHKHQDWKLNGTTPSGGKKGEDFWYDDQYHNVTDIQDSKTDGTSETTKVDDDQGAFEADFTVDNPGDKHDEDGSLVGQHRSKHEFDEHKGPDYYDSHEETNDQSVASGSFDTFDEAEHAMSDFEEHINMPESQGLPFEQSKPHHSKREASSEWVIGNVNKFDVEVSNPSLPVAQPAHVQEHQLQVRTISPESAQSLYIAALCIFCIATPLAVIALIWYFTRKLRAQKQALKLERENNRRLMREGFISGDVELATVRAREKEGNSGSAA